MNEHERYMADFFKVYEALENWGPGTEQETLKALKQLPAAPNSILEIGCGNGLATKVLAIHTNAKITAVDNEAPALQRMMARVTAAGVDHKVKPLCASMTDLPIDERSCDLIWAEGSAYIMGVVNALKQWRSLLKEQGTLVYSDLVWLTDAPSKEASDFWHKEYPDMTSVAERIDQAEQNGYKVVDSFAFSKEASDAYYVPLQLRVNQLTEELQGSAAFLDIQKELDIYRQYHAEFGYQMLVLQKSTCKRSITKRD